MDKQDYIKVNSFCKAKGKRSNKVKVVYFLIAHPIGSSYLKYVRATYNSTVKHTHSYINGMIKRI